mgnify:FL=1
MGTAELLDVVLSHGVAGVEAVALVLLWRELQVTRRELEALHAARTEDLRALAGVVERSAQVLEMSSGGLSRRPRRYRNEGGTDGR